MKWNQRNHWECPKSEYSTSRRNTWIRKYSIHWGWWFVLLTCLKETNEKKRRCALHSNFHFSISIGWDSGVASSSSLQIYSSFFIPSLTLMDLSASQVIKRVPVKSNVLAKIPASLSNDPTSHPFLSPLPGWTTVRSSWKQYPVFQSQNRNIPLSPPANNSPCRFTEIVFNT